MSGELSAFDLAKMQAFGLTPKNRPWKRAVCQLCGRVIEIVEFPYQQIGVCNRCAEVICETFIFAHSGDYFNWRVQQGSHAKSKSDIPIELRARVFARDGFECVKCGATHPLTADHIIAESKGGKTTLENLQTLCKPCNSSKGTKDNDIFMGAK